MTEADPRRAGYSVPSAVASTPASSLRLPRASADGRPVKVTRAQVRAARGRIQVDERLGRQTPDWIRRVAAAKPARAR